MLSKQDLIKIVDQLRQRESDIKSDMQIFGDAKFFNGDYYQDRLAKLLKVQSLIEKVDIEIEKTDALEEQEYYKNRVFIR